MIDMDLENSLETLCDNTSGAEDSGETDGTTTSYAALKADQVFQSWVQQLNRNQDKRRQNDWTNTQWKHN